MKVTKNNLQTGVKLTLHFKILKEHKRNQVSNV